MQETWLIDTDPFLRSKVMNLASQDNLKDVIIWQHGRCVSQRGGRLIARSCNQGTWGRMV